MNSINEHPIERLLIERQLQKIMSFNQFRNFQAFSLFLKFVVEETLAGHTHQLEEYTIATKVLGRSDDFSPQLDAGVRIQAARVRRLLNDYYQSKGQNDNVLISIPEGSYMASFQIRLQDNG